MKKFNSKKWIVENKYGKQPSHSNYGSGNLNEQEENSVCYLCFSSLDIDDPEIYDYFSSQVDPETGVIAAEYAGPAGSPGAGFCMGTLSYQVAPGQSTNTATMGNTNPMGPYAGANCEVIDTNPSDEMATGAQGQMNMAVSVLAQQGPVCCDHSSDYYGHNAQGVLLQGPNSVNVTDTYLMTGMGDTTYCDDSLCSGDPVDAMAPMPSRDKAPFKDKRKEKGPGKPTSALKYREPVTEDSYEDLYEDLLNEADECTNHYMCPAFMICNNQGFCVDGDINDQAPPSRDMTNPLGGCPCPDGTINLSCCDGMEYNKTLDKKAHYNKQFRSNKSSRMLNEGQNCTSDADCGNGYCNMANTSVMNPQGVCEGPGWDMQTQDCPEGMFGTYPDCVTGPDPISSPSKGTPNPLGGCPCPDGTIDLSCCENNQMATFKNQQKGRSNAFKRPFGKRR